MNAVPMVSIDNSDDIQLFISEEAKHSVEIVTSKSSEMNVVFPQDDDFVEYAIPEQYKTTITPSGLATIVAVAHQH
jgi:adenylyl cyclase-associated protein